ncbi:MAG: hypothetical protein ABEN55_02520 [Bradymonadaceae bacterium]
MTQTSPDYHDLADDPDDMIRHPSEDLRLTLDFGEDVSGWNFEVQYDPKKWPATNETLDQVGDGSWDNQNNPGYFSFDNQGKTLQIVIPSSEIRDWRRRTMYVSLLADNGSVTWEVETITVTSQRHE